MVQIHLDQETANLGLEDWMDSRLFAREYLLHRADFAAGHHIQVTVVDRMAGHRADLVVVRNEGEVQRLAAGGVQVIRTLFGGDDGLSQAIDLSRFLLKLFFGDVDRDIELRDLGAQLGLLFKHLERVGACRVLLQNAVG